MIEKNGNSCCIIKENNDAYCLPTDRLLLEYFMPILNNLKTVVQNDADASG